MDDIQALPTPFGDHNFRSRLEARWAVLFNTLGIEFQYEPEGFQLGTDRYIPDFYFPKVRMFAEVKPREFDEREMRLAMALSASTKCAVLLLIGPPAFKPYPAVHPVYLEDGIESETWYYIFDIDIHRRRYYEQGRLFCCAEPWEMQVGHKHHFSAEYQAAVFESHTYRFDPGGRF